MSEASLINQWDVPEDTKIYFFGEKELEEEIHPKEFREQNR